MRPAVGQSLQDGGVPGAAAVWHLEHEAGGNDGTFLRPAADKPCKRQIHMCKMLTAHECTCAPCHPQVLYFTNITPAVAVVVCAGFTCMTDALAARGTYDVLRHTWLEPPSDVRFINREMSPSGVKVDRLTATAGGGVSRAARVSVCHTLSTRCTEILVKLCAILLVELARRMGMTGVPLWWAGGCLLGSTQAFVALRASLKTTCCCCAQHTLLGLMAAVRLLQPGSSTFCSQAPVSTTFAARKLPHWGVAATPAQLQPAIGSAVPGQRATAEYDAPAAAHTLLLYTCTPGPSHPAPGRV